jgi:hypothetical protein
MLLQQPLLLHQHHRRLLNHSTALRWMMICLSKKKEDIGSTSHQ